MTTAESRSRTTARSTTSASCAANCDALGARFRSTGDTEVVLRAYERVGRGSRRAARRDVRHRDLGRAVASRLLLARDRTGKKPLFYWSDGAGSFSARRSRRCSPAHGSSASSTRRGSPEFLTFGYVPNPCTLYRRNPAGPASSVLSFGREAAARAARATGTRSTTTVRPRPGDAARATSARCSATPSSAGWSPTSRSGALLSGGIDSSLVVALMSRLSRRAGPHVPIGFTDDPRFDERSYARVGRRALRHPSTPSSRSSWTQCACSTGCSGTTTSPTWTRRRFPLTSSAELASEHVIVALNGDGGDEVFGGYDRFRAAALSVRLPPPAARHAPPRRGCRSTTPTTRPSAALQRFLELADQPVEARYQSWIAVADDGSHRSLLAPDVLAAATAPVLTRWTRCYRHAEHLPVLDRILYANFMTYLPDDLAVKMDRMSMAHSLETRSPFLDTALIERSRGRAARGKVGPAAQAGAAPRVLATSCRARSGIGASTVSASRWADGSAAASARCSKTRSLRRTRACQTCCSRRRSRSSTRRIATASAEHGFRLWTVLTLERWLRDARTTSGACAALGRTRSGVAPRL